MKVEILATVDRFLYLQVSDISMSTIDLENAILQWADRQGAKARADVQTLYEDSLSLEVSRGVTCLWEKVIAQSAQFASAISQRSLARLTVIRSGDDFKMWQDLDFLAAVNVCVREQARLNKIRSIVDPQHQDKAEFIAVTLTCHDPTDSDLWIHYTETCAETLAPSS